MSPVQYNTSPINQSFSVNMYTVQLFSKTNQNNLSSLKSILGPPALCDVKSCASVNCSLITSAVWDHLSEKVRSTKSFFWATKQLLLNINELHVYLFKEAMQKVLTTSLNSIINVSVKNRCSALEMLPGSIEIMMKPWQSQWAKDFEQPTLAFLLISSR